MGFVFFRDLQPTSGWLLSHHRFRCQRTLIRPRLFTRLPALILQPHIALCYNVKGIFRLVVCPEWEEGTHPCSTPSNLGGIEPHTFPAMLDNRLPCR